MSAVGGYELLGRVGVGSTATVWKARDEKLGRDVALKQVGTGTPQEVDRLRGEAAVLAALSDDHIVEVFGFFEEDGSAYLVEQWIDGATLAATLAAGASFSAQQALGVSRGALLGLTHAHSRDVIHGDVSTGNILIDTDGVSRLIDFGRGESGTPAYRSPEVATGEDPTKPSDVYAAAAVLVHLLTGASSQPPGVANVEAGLRPVLEKALATDPGERYADAAEFLAALEEAAISRYGAGWWTQAGVGALVAPGIAVLSAVGGGGAAVATATTGAGAVAAPGSIAAAEGAAPAVAAAGASPVTEVAATAAKSGTKMWLIGGVAAAVILVGGGVAIANRGGDNKTEGAADTTNSSSNADETAEEEPSEEAEPDPAAELEATQPIGVWNMKESGWDNYRDGSRTKAKPGKGVTWTFSDGTCVATGCEGTLTSSGGAVYAYQWSGGDLLLTREPLLEDKQACVDQTTGEARPIDQSAARGRITFAITPFSVTATDDDGVPTKITGSLTQTRKVKYFGDCEPDPKGYVGSERTIVATRQG